MVSTGDVEVLVHEAVGVAYPVEALADLAEEGEPLLAVSIIQIDRLSPVAARGNVVQDLGNSTRKGRDVYCYYSGECCNAMQCKT